VQEILTSSGVLASKTAHAEIIAETLQRSISMNSNNESRAVSPEMSHRGLIDVESQHMR
jgi:hypothetical protein